MNLAGGTLQNGNLTSANGVASTGGTVSNIAGSTGLSATAGTTTLNGSNSYTGATTINGGTVLGGAANALSAASATTINSSGTLDLGGYAQTVDALAGAGIVTNGGSASAILSNRGLSSVFSGTISDGTSQIGLNQSMSGSTLALTGANNYSGGTYITAGTLQIGNGGATGSITGNVVDNDALAFDRNNVIAFSGIISGSGALVQIGSGKLVLSASNSYTGGTLVSSGVLDVQNSMALGSGAVTLNPGTQLVIDGNGLNVANRFILQSSDPTVTVNVGTIDALSGEIAGAGTLTINGGGTLILNGLNSYTGATTVNSTNLVVNGSIAASAQLTLTGGSTLSGTGMVGSLAVGAGSILKPGSGIPGSQILISGNLSFATGSIYEVSLNPTVSTSTIVNGAASLSGASVQVNLATGQYFTNHYKILEASGGLGGTVFSGLTSINLPTGLRDYLSYDANDVYLNLIATLGTGSTINLPGNQQRVANSINNFFNGGGAIPNSYLSLFALSGSPLRQAMTSLAGELPTAAPTVAEGVTGSFLSAMLDPFVQGRKTDCLDNNNSQLKGNGVGNRSDCAYTPKYTIWATSIGGSGNINGDPIGIGTHDVADDNFGSASGLDIHVTSNTAFGIAVAGGRAQWSLAQGLGHAHSNYFELGVSGSIDFGNSYLNGAFSYSWHDVVAERTIFANDSISSSFHAHDLGGRVEAGTHFGGLSPYMALQNQKFTMPNFGETDASGGGFALDYSGRGFTDTSAEVGTRFDVSTPITGSESISLRLRAAYVRDWVRNPELEASFTSLPGTNFTVTGALPSRESAKVSSALEYHIGDGGTFFVKFDGAYAKHAQSYQGSFGIRFNW